MCKIPKYARWIALLFTWPTLLFAVTIPLHVLEKDEVTMRLMGTPCVDPVSARIGLNLPPELYGKLQAIESTWLMKDGTRKDFPGCWVEVDAKLAGEDGYFVIFSDGTYGVVPKAYFLKTKGSVGV